MRATGRPTRLLLLLLLLVFWAVALRHLDVLPRVYEDEPWIAGTGWMLATEGRFGNAFFAGFYGMERHAYNYLPLYPLLQAPTFRGLGLGLFQARLLVVGLTMLTLAMTFAVGRRLFGAATGTLAVLLLLVTRTSILSPSQISGIVMVDFARVARYDMLVPVLGLAALYLFVGARGRWGQTMMVGGLAGLSGLANMYGLFWVGLIVLLALWQRAGRRAVAAILMGALLPWLPYGLFVLSGLEDWRGQTQIFNNRFALTEPGWYLANLLAEPRRYAPGLGPGGWTLLGRPGLVAAGVGLPLALAALARRAWRGERAAQSLLLPAVGLPLLFAALIWSKATNYLVTILPLLALVGAWGGVSLWRRVGGAGWGRVARAALLALLLLIVGEGVGQLVRAEGRARETTPYAHFIARVHDEVPAGARVLGMHHYWLTFEDQEYISWAVPILQASPGFYRPPRPIGAALDAVDPDVILIDPRMTGYLEATPDRAAAIRAWMEQNGFMRRAVVEDGTYGRMEIYRRETEKGAGASLRPPPGAVGRRTQIKIIWAPSAISRNSMAPTTASTSSTRSSSSRCIMSTDILQA